MASFVRSNQAGLGRLAAVFALALGGSLFAQKFLNAEEARVFCVDNLIIPTSAAGADVLKKNEGALMNAMDKTRPANQSHLVAAMIDEELAKGNTVTFKGLDKNGATSTLHDGTVRPVACYKYTVHKPG